MQRHKSTGPQAIGALRQQFLQRYALPLQQTLPVPANLLEQCQREWPQLAGASSQFSYPAKLKEDTLIVHVQHSVYLSDFQFYKNEVEKKLSQYSNGAVQKVRARLKDHAPKK